MANVNFKYGAYADYQKLAVKDSNTLYFTTDTLQIFKGATEYTKSVKMVSALPESGQVQGVVYLRTNDFTLHTYNGTEYVQLTKGAVTTIPASGATDTTVPTTKAVADYVNDKIAGVVGGKGVFVTDVSYESGVLSVAKGDAPVTTTLTGVVHDATYDAETRTISLPVFGGDALTINLGKDLVVTSGKYDTKTKEIQLTITSGDVIKIPVGSLIDIYTGIATSSAEVTVNDQNQISVNVKVSAKANNSIVLETDGLYVAVPDAYTKAQADEKVKVVQDALDAHKADTVVHVTAAERKTWNEKVDVNQLATAKSDAIATAAEDATTKADAARDAAKTYADGLNTAMDGRVKAVEAAVAWQTIA